MFQVWLLEAQPAVQVCAVYVPESVPEVQVRVSLVHAPVGVALKNAVTDWPWVMLPPHGSEQPALQL